MEKDEENLDQYLEFIKKLVLQYTQELAKANQPRSRQDNTVVFSIDFGSNLHFEQAGSKNRVEESKEAEKTEKTQYNNKT